MAVLAAPYLPRRPTETVLYGLVRQHLESFLAYARERYDGGLPRYVEHELRAYLKCGVFSEGFSRAHCETCGHDLLVAFSCKSRTACPSCAGRRMANTAAAIVDRVLPDVPLRQYVLSLPYELRKLAAFKADVLTALGRIFVDAIFASYRARASLRGLEDGRGGAINFVQRFGSLNLNVHFHIAAVDGVFTRDPDEGVLFHPASAPTGEDLALIVQRVRDRFLAWLRRQGYLDERPIDERSNEPAAQTALDACAAIAIGRGHVATLPNPDVPNGDVQQDDDDQAPDKPTFAIERDGFNLHAGVRIEAGDDLGRERLCRYGARPPLSLERLRRLAGGKVAYRLKYVSRGRGKHRVMTAMEFMARLAALIAPPRYPLVRYAGVLGPLPWLRRDGGVEVTPWCIRGVGSVEMTRKDRESVLPLPDEIVIRLRRQRERETGKSYSAADFKGDARTLDGRHALRLCRERAARLVREMATAPAHSEVAAYLHHLVLTVAVGFGGRVSLPNVVAAVQSALTDYASAGPAGRVRVHVEQGRLADAPAESLGWPVGLMRPEAVPQAMLRELAKGSAWRWDEAWTPPSPDEGRRLTMEIDPGAWDRTVAQAVEGRDSIRSQDVYDALFAAGLLASDTPNAEQRGRCSATLKAMGFERSEGTDADGKRFRVWRRACPPRGRRGRRGGRTMSTRKPGA